MLVDVVCVDCNFNWLGNICIDVMSTCDNKGVFSFIKELINRHSCPPQSLETEVWLFVLIQ